jgi:GDP-L-fucose synthase
MAPMILHINVGARIDITIKELAKTIVKVVGFKGKLRFNTSRPVCVPRKVLNVRRLKKLGW